MFAVIYIPDFALQAVLRQEPELCSQPVVLIEEESAKAKILQLTESARVAGIHEGMTSTQAMARCGTIRIRPRSPTRERIAQDILLQFAATLSPWIENTAPGVCTLQISQHSTLNSQHSTFSQTARIGIAETPDLAFLAARQADPILVVGDTRNFLDTLPVSALEPSPEILAILDKWAIRTLGQFIALGKEALARRLGPEALTLFDRATGTLQRPLRFVPPPETFEESIEFEHEIETLDPLLFMLRRFLELITRRLEMSYLAVSELTLRLTFAPTPDSPNHKSAATDAEGNGQVVQIRNQKFIRKFPLPEPTCNVDTLFRMLHTHLENFTAGSPIVALHLAAEPCRPGHQQFGLFETALRDPNRFYETLARLTALVGSDRVGTPQALDTHRPDAFQIVPFTEEIRNSREEIRNQKSEIRNSIGLALRRFRPPLSADVQLKDGQPSFIFAPGVAASVRAVQGPWLNSGGWWDTQAWGREEWDVELPGGIFRLFEQVNGWFLEGSYD